MKTLIKIFIVGILFSSCKKKDLELVTVNAVAYVDGNKALANFALINPNDYRVINSDRSVDIYLSSKPDYAQIATTDFNLKVPTGEYILIIQLKEGKYGTLTTTYTYNYITTRGASAKTSYAMQFTKSKQSFYQPWVDKQ